MYMKMPTANSASAKFYKKIFLQKFIYLLKVKKNLKKMRRRRRFALPLKIRNVNQLKFVDESGVRPPEFLLFQNVRQIGQFRVTPIIKRSQTGPRSPLGIEKDRRDPEADEAREHRLFQVGIFLERQILNDRRQLVMVPNHDPALQPVPTVLGILNLIN